MSLLIRNTGQCVWNEWSEKDIENSNKDFVVQPISILTVTLIILIFLAEHKMFIKHEKYTGAMKGKFSKSDLQKLPPIQE